METRSGETLKARYTAKAAAMLATVAAAGMLAAPSAQAQTYQQKSAPQNCVIVIDKAGKVKSQRCSSDPAELEAISAASTPIIQLFDLPHFGGVATIIRGEGNVGGGDGCDYAGYRISHLGSWVNRTSSFITRHGCNAVNLHNLPNYGDHGHGFRNPGAATISVPVMPAGFDNNVESIALWRM
ncbi:hypothetical protein ITP53_06515 [Nonomuraea sp. K274]|uniref:Secreted protein n=1 Tax=Nonomuraea cypriaca TaxID=1187855 RepID=A0A931A8M3_9ACTN|nr:hypothetical protein [Nonomuraea cypriaca]MBF8185395.1 hypothetical protein [Nonomuraea cypriaca]